MSYPLGCPVAWSHRQGIACCRATDGLFLPAKDCLAFSVFGGPDECRRLPLGAKDARRNRRSMGVVRRPAACPFACRLVCRPSLFLCPALPAKERANGLHQGRGLWRAQ
jgi:hypothetical protein